MALDRDGFAAVSAATGDYRFLDLPGPGTQRPQIQRALSPDGRRVAYWHAGPVGRLQWPGGVVARTDLDATIPGRSSVSRCRLRMGSCQANWLDTTVASWPSSATCSANAGKRFRGRCTTSSAARLSAGRCPDPTGVEQRHGGDPSSPSTLDQRVAPDGPSWSGSSGCLATSWPDAGAREDAERVAAVRDAYGGRSTSSFPKDPSSWLTCRRASSRACPGRRAPSPCSAGSGTRWWSSCRRDPQTRRGRASSSSSRHGGLAAADGDCDRRPPRGRGPRAGCPREGVGHWTKIAAHPEPYVRKVLARESITRWRRRRGARSA